MWTRQAEYHFEKGQMELAAQYFSKTTRTFEDVALRFLTIQNFDALRTFLKASSSL